MASTSASKPADRLNPARIQLARERRGLSKVALARELGLTSRVVQTYETDGAPAARAPELARALGFQPGFFSRPEPTIVSPGQGFFRATRRATAAELAAARAVATLGVELYEWIVERFALPELVVPDLDGLAPETAADALRAAWGRNQEPLPNLVQLCEAHGVRVLSLPTDTESVDAFSLWLHGAPYVFLSMAKTAVRSRFDLAHELGHLVMHSRISQDAGARELEREADAFASAFLMPTRAILAQAGREPAVPEILRLRGTYRVSAMAMTHRLHDLSRLTDWGARQNYAELARRGFRKGEPGDLPRELSRVFASVLSVFRRWGTPLINIATELGLDEKELHGLTFGHAAVTVGGAQTLAPSHVGHLRLVT